MPLVKQIYPNLYPKQIYFTPLIYLIEHIAHIRLRLAEPHGQQFWAFDANEICLTFVRDSFSQQGLATSRRSIEQNAARRLHAELEEFFRMLDWILDEFLKLALDVLQPTNILPAYVRCLDDHFTQRRRTVLAQCELKIKIISG